MWEMIQLFAYAVVMVLLAGLVLPLAGLQLLLRRVPFHAVTLPQLATAGLSLGYAALPWYLANVGLGDLSLGEALDSHHALPNYLFAWAIGTTAVGLAALAFGNRDREAARGAGLFVLAMGITVLASMVAPIGGEEIASLMRGEILAVDRHDLEPQVIVYALAGGYLFWRRRRVAFAGSDPETYAAHGGRPGQLRLGVLIAVAAVAVVSSVLMGPLVTLAGLVFPPMAGRALARSIGGAEAWSVGLGLLSAVVGVVLSFGLDWPMGPALVVAAAGVWVLGALGSRLRG
ncbi:MAG: metal ABC transporter permease [Planctomycetota bacterium]|jgi:zinc transport system permease protein